ncbi:MAG TPA: PilZ domain-containing protein [Deferrisomatales bacterium]|nr:PilZ domain-containing protein [Deferrisomatales bacterium]
MSMDRREAPHQRVSISALYRADGEQRCANLFDLGSDGVFICTREPLAPGSRLDLTIHTPGDRGFMYADGLVVWTNLVHSDAVPAGMGIRFLSVDPEDRERLLAQLEMLS